MIQDSIYVVLVEPRYDGNVGSVARVMKNFGFSRLVLVKPPEIGSEARAKAMHALDVLENAWTAGSLEELENKLDFLVATTAKVAGDGNTLRTPVMPWKLDNALESKGKIGLVFGREDYGLLNEEIELCDMQVTIPASPEYPTLNVAQSVGILLYELSRESMALKLKGKKLRELDGERKRVLLEKYNAVVDEVYKKDFEKDLARKTFRQLVGRAFISGREAQTLIGLLRHVREGLK